MRGVIVAYHKFKLIDSVVQVGESEGELVIRGDAGGSGVSSLDALRIGRF